MLAFPLDRTSRLFAIKRDRPTLTHAMRYSIKTFFSQFKLLSTGRRRTGGNKSRMRRGTKGDAAFPPSYLGAVEQADKYYRGSPGKPPPPAQLFPRRAFPAGALGAIAAIYNVNERSLRVHVGWIHVGPADG